MTDTPPEPPGGQDDPPDVRTAVVAVLWLLNDVLEHFERPHNPDTAEALRVRIHAHRRALRRLRDRL